MTSAAGDHHLPNLPAWYRLLPKPTTDHNPVLRPTSSLSQHHLFHDRSQNHTSLGEDGIRRNTVHVPISDNTRSINTTGSEYIGAPQVDGGSGLTSPSLRGPSLEMAMTEPHPPAARSDSNPRENVCLCPASPKIPRPRNSFILFRQHQQASIIAQNPGIPNPEVSKIIGEQWRGLSAEAKEEWNLLAEEEKARHQQQYPGYRYHPRRNGRVSNQSSVSGPSSAEPQEPCAKCGGRPMNCYNNPIPVYTPPASTAQQTMAVTVPAKRGYVVTTAPPSQRISPEHTGFQRVEPRLVYAVPPPGQTLPTPPSAESQDAKRRRLGNGVYIPAREVYPEATYAYAHSPTTHGGYLRQEILHPSQLQRIPATKPQMVSPPRAYPRPPPLQPIRPPHPHQRNRSAVALPPIETLVSQPPAKPSATQFQNSGVEAMIMSIPVLNKIKVLSQLAGPLPPPGITSPKPEVRGAIVAVEGTNATSVDSMTHSLAEQLEKDGKFAVRIFGGPDPYSLLPGSESRATGEKKGTDVYLRLMTQWHELNREIVDFITSRQSGGPRASSITLDLHSAGRDISAVEVSRLPPQTPDEVVGMGTSQQLEKEIDSAKLDVAISPKTVLVRGADLSTKLASCNPPGHKGRSLSTPGVWTYNENSSTSHNAPPPPPRYTRPPNSKRIPPPPPSPPTPPTASPPPPSSTKDTVPTPAASAIPIAIVPHFQLTTVDACSISMPINDSFSPPAHWQWFAAMWRGSVGPDITIVIRGVDEEPAEGADVPNATAIPSIPAATNANGQGTRDRLPSVASSQSHSSGTGVEIRIHDSRAVIVKTGVVGSTAAGGHGKAPDKTTAPAQLAKELENWEKAKRRVGFEVEEFLRR